MPLLCARAGRVCGGERMSRLSDPPSPLAPCGTLERREVDAPRPRLIGPWPLGRDCGAWRRSGVLWLRLDVGWPPILGRQSSITVFHSCMVRWTVRSSFLPSSATIQFAYVSASRGALHPGSVQVRARPSCGPARPGASHARTSPPRRPRSTASVH